ncbi:MAG TPA: phosphatase PAP2 family protein [Vicinamibacterales bacterium]|nr:phosphatase PAP2 family protein [Vicinamibacterales bacterium]
MLTAAWATITIALALQTPAPQKPAPDPASWPDDKPFTQLLPNLWTDLQALPTKDNAVIAAIGSIVTASVHPGDDNAAEWAKNGGDSGLASLGNVIGDGWFQASGAVATYAIGRLSHEPRVTHVGSDLVRGQILNALLTSAIKVTVDRTRPSGGHYSFPSGHSSATFTSAAILESHFGWKVGAPAYAVGAFVSWSRVRDSAHWISDTVAGATLGIIVGETITRGHRERDWHVVPTKTPGGFAVFVTRVK